MRYADVAHSPLSRQTRLRSANIRVPTLSARGDGSRSNQESRLAASRDKVRGEVIAVPQYFFTVQAPNGDLEDDRISKALPDITAALAHAERLIRELQKEGGYDDPGLKMFVKDESQQTVLFLPFVACGD
jgi:hypothetical protein